MVDKEYRYCQGCVFAFPCFGTMLMCTYFLTTDIRRPCPAGDGCTVKRTGKRLSKWEYEKEYTWELRQKQEKRQENKPKPTKEVFHRKCLECGKAFDTTDSRQVYCCRKCGEKFKHSKAKAKRPVYHRTCKECGTEFDTTNQRKIFCCRDHAFKYKQRERYRREKKQNPLLENKESKNRGI